MSVSSTIPAAAAADPLVRVYTLMATLRRRWRLWVATALVGFVLGGAFFFANPLQWSATTEVLLRRPTTTSVDPTKAMATDVQIAESVPVAVAAIGRLRPGVLSGYTVVALTNDVLEITSHSATAAAAVQSADTVANAFLSVRGQQQEQEAAVLGAALAKEAGPLMAQLAAINVEISSAVQQNPSSGSQDDLGDLLMSRAQVNGELASIQQQSSEATVAASVAAQNSRVLDPASPTRPSKKLTLATDLLAGLIGGAAVGAGWVMFGAVTTERVRRRDHLMAALDAPVAVSTGAVLDGHGHRVRAGRIHVQHMRRELRKPGRDVTTMARQLRSALAASDTSKPALIVVSVESDWSASLAIATAATQLRSEGNAILLVDFTKQAVLARLLRAPGTLSIVHPGPPASKLWRRAHPIDFNDSLDEWLQLSNLGNEADIILVLATLDPATGAEPLVSLAKSAVVVVTAGRSTATALRSTGQMIRAEGVHLHSAILVGADRRDETCGVRPRLAVATGDRPTVQQTR